MPKIVCKNSTQTKKCLECEMLFEEKPSKFCSLACATAYSLRMGDFN